jgi:hypothetical protein
MFEIGFDQAAGLRARQRPATGAGLMAVACPAQPARAYELLCTLAAHLKALDRAAVIVDGSATESAGPQRGDGCHLGLLHALRDPTITGLARPVDTAEWLVMPGALGLQSLQDTARAGGAGVALSRLLAPFEPQALVLLFAPAFSLGQLLTGSSARVLVPVLEQPQATFDAYGAVKVLHGAGLAPVLAPLASPEATPALQQTVDTVTDCAQRHLGLALDAWPVHTWGQRVQEAALTCAPRAGQARAVPAATRAAGAFPLWS